MNAQAFLDNIPQFLTTTGGDLIIKLATAIVACVIGRFLIKLAVRLLGRLLTRGGKIDQTLTNYLKTMVSVLLTVVLILAILEVFGIKTTSFAALLAGAGVAIGAAWSGMLGNFAAGLFMQVLRPYKIGDFVEAGGIKGTVKTLGILTTTFETPDSVVAIVGNNKIFSDNIKNYSALPMRQVRCSIKVANSVDPMEAIDRLKPVIAAIPNVATDPAPFFGISEFTPEGPVISVSPYTENANYWTVFFAVNKAIVETFAEAKYPVPQTPVAYTIKNAPPVV